MSVTINTDEIRGKIYKNILYQLETTKLDERYLHKTFTRMQLTAKSKKDTEAVNQIEQLLSATKEKVKQLETKLENAKEIWDIVEEKGVINE